MNEDYCVCCGEYVPEGSWVCPACEIESAGKKQAILNHLVRYHTGCRNAVHSKSLEEFFGIGSRTLRRQVNSLRKDGYPICSGDMGYYYAENQKDVNTTVRRLNEYVMGVSNAKTAMLNASVAPVMNIKITVDFEG